MFCSRSSRYSSNPSPLYDLASASILISSKAGLIHFIEKYNLRVPQAFIDHAARQRWHVSGELDPAFPNTGEANREQNRRVEIKVPKARA